MAIRYQVEDGIVQTIRMKINEDFAFPETFRIVKAEVFTFHKYPREKVWKDGTGKVSKVCGFSTWMRLYDDEGNMGEGPVFADAVDTFLPLLLKDREERTNLDWRRIFYWYVRGDTSKFPAINQIEVILLDLIARRRGQPLYRMLGARRNWVSAYMGGGSVLRTDEELVEELLKIKERGFSCTKFKIGIGEMDRDIRRMALVREALGPDMQIAVDANQAWDAETAIRFLQETEQYDIAWFEEPVNALDMEELAKLMGVKQENGLKTPIAMGESAFAYETLSSYVNAGADILQALPMRQYTLGETVKAIRYAHAMGRHCTTGQSYLNGALAGLFLDEDEPIEFHLPNEEGVSDYYKIKGRLENGKLYLPDIPGIPVRPDMEKLEKEGLLEKVVTYMGR